MENCFHFTSDQKGCSFSHVDQRTFLHLSSQPQEQLLNRTFGNQRIFQQRQNSPVSVMVSSAETRRFRFTRVPGHRQPHRTCSLFPPLSLSLSYIIRFAALLSLPAAFVFPSSSSSSSYFIPRIITPLTSEPNTFIANQLLLRTTFMASQTSDKKNTHHTITLHKVNGEPLRRT